MEMEMEVEMEMEMEKEKEKERERERERERWRWRWRWRWRRRRRRRRGEREREREGERERGREGERERDSEAQRLSHFSVHQWVGSAIHASPQRTFPIGFLSLKLPPPPCAVLLVMSATHDTYEIFYLLVFSPFWYGLGMFGSLSFICIHIQSSDSFSVRWFELAWTPSKTEQFVAICIASDFSAPASFTLGFSGSAGNGRFSPMCCCFNTSSVGQWACSVSSVMCSLKTLCRVRKHSYAFQTRWLESVAGDVFWQL